MNEALSAAIDRIEDRLQSAAANHAKNLKDGSVQQIYYQCDFTAGARFVIDNLKRCLK